MRADRIHEQVAEAAGRRRRSRGSAGVIATMSMANWMNVWRARSGSVARQPMHDAAGGEIADDARQGRGRVGCCRRCAARRRRQNTTQQQRRHRAAGKIEQPEDAPGEVGRGRAGTGRDCRFRALRATASTATWRRILPDRGASLARALRRSEFRENTARPSPTSPRSPAHESARIPVESSCLPSTAFPSRRARSRDAAGGGRRGRRRWAAASGS